jgi:hypothetical protein
VGTEMIDILLASLVEYITMKRDHIGGQVEIEHVVEAKKRFAQSLDEYIDGRISKRFETHRRHQSQQRLKIADTINSSMQSASKNIKSLSALNSAPTPPSDSSDKEAMKKWMEAYSAWYEDSRKKGLSDI